MNTVLFYFFNNSQRNSLMNRNCDDILTFARHEKWQMRYRQRTAFFSESKIIMSNGRFIFLYFFYFSLSLRLSPQRMDTQSHVSTNERDVPVWSTQILNACPRPTPEISDPLHHPRPPDDIVALQLRTEDGRFHDSFFAAGTT